MLLLLLRPLRPPSAVWTTCNLRSRVRLWRTYLTDSAAVSGATGKTLPPLAPVNHWAERYQPSKILGNVDRHTLFNPATIADVVKSYGLDDGGEPKTVIEIYPGPGAITRELLKLPRTVLKKLIVCEFVESYQPDLKALAEVDDRLQIMPQAAYFWSVYEDMQTQGHLDGIIHEPFDKIHSSLRLVGHLPLAVTSEQWLSQILRHIPPRAWLWSYGRMPLHLLMPRGLWKRVTAEPGDPDLIRCKLSVISQANCHLEESLPSEDLLPHSGHFFVVDKSPRKTKKRKSPDSFVSVKITPKSIPLIKPDEVEEWDFVLRALFVQKSKPFMQSLPNLAPGASVLLERLAASATPEDHLNVTKTIRQLTIDDWAKVIKAFKDWPFRPTALRPPTKADWKFLVETT